MRVSGGGPSACHMDQTWNPAVHCTRRVRCLCLRSIYHCSNGVRASRNQMLLPILAGATNATLVLPSVQTQDSGPYPVVVINACGALTSAVASVSVLLPPQLRWTGPNAGAFVFTRSSASRVSAMRLRNPPTFSNGPRSPPCVRPTAWPASATRKQLIRAPHFTAPALRREAQTS
jgi:hypothetical protein